MSDRRAFVRSLAEYLVADAAEMSVKLQMGLPEAKRWAKLRDATPLFGWPSVDEAERQLGEWLFGKDLYEPAPVVPTQRDDRDDPGRGPGRRRHR